MVLLLHAHSPPGPSTKARPGAGTISSRRRITTLVAWRLARKGIYSTAPSATAKPFSPSYATSPLFEASHVHQIGSSRVGRRRLLGRRSRRARMHRAAGCLGVDGIRGAPLL